MNEEVLCKYCHESFTTARRDKIYCKRACKEKQQSLDRRSSRKRLTRSAKIKKKKTDFIKSSFGLWLLSTLRRHGTVQVLAGNTAELLSQLYTLKKECSSFSGFLDGAPAKVYELSHIFSVAGNSTHIGLLRVDNLVICPVNFNRSRKRAEEAVDGKGSSIPRNSLKPRFSCHKTDSNSTIVAKIQKFLGKEFEEFLLANSFSPGIKATLFKIASEFQKVDSHTTIEDLKKIIENEGAIIPSFDRKSAPLSAVLHQELERLGFSGHWTYWIVNQVHQASLHIRHPARISGPDIAQDTEFVFQQALNLLHGQEVAYLNQGRPAIDSFRLPHSYKILKNVDSVWTPLDHHCFLLGNFHSPDNIFSEEMFYARLDF